MEKSQGFSSDEAGLIARYERKRASDLRMASQAKPPLRNTYESIRWQHQNLFLSERSPLHDRPRTVQHCYFYPRNRSLGPCPIRPAHSGRQASKPRVIAPRSCAISLLDGLSVEVSQIRFWMHSTATRISPKLRFGTYAPNLASGPHCYRRFYRGKSLVITGYRWPGYFGP